MVKMELFESNMLAYFNRQYKGVYKPAECNSCQQFTVIMK
jgi:hypothetical protein